MARAAAKKATLAPGGYVGKEALTIARRANGTQVYVWRGQPVPTDIPDAELLRLAEGGYIAPKATPAAEKTRTASRTSTGKADPTSTEGASGKTGDDAKGAEGAGGKTGDDPKDTGNDGA